MPLASSIEAMGIMYSRFRRKSDQRC
jgi:hypothetical protein